MKVSRSKAMLTVFRNLFKGKERHKETFVYLYLKSGQRIKAKYDEDDDFMLDEIFNGFDEQSKRSVPFNNCSVRMCEVAAIVYKESIFTWR